MEEQVQGSRWKHAWGEAKRSMWLKQSGWGRGGIGDGVRKVAGPDEVRSCKEYKLHGKPWEAFHDPAPSSSPVPFHHAPHLWPCSLAVLSLPRTAALSAWPSPTVPHRPPWMPIPLRGCPWHPRLHGVLLSVFWWCPAAGSCKSSYLHEWELSL